MLGSKHLHTGCFQWRIFHIYYRYLLADVEKLVNDTSVWLWLELGIG